MGVIKAWPNLAMPDAIQIKSGFCYLADMNPPRKSKSGKLRPVIVIQSDDIIEAGSPGIVILPCTSKLDQENVLRVRLNPSAGLKLGKASDVLVDQLHTIDRSFF